MTWRGNRWVSFLEYLTMLDMGQADAVQRNYAVEYEPHFKGPDWHTYAVSAAERMGFDTPGVALNNLLASVQAMLRSYGYVMSDLQLLERRMCAWYTWDRIRTGSLRRARKRPIDNPLI
jgi:hypothetical protein